MKRKLEVYKSSSRFNRHVCLDQVTGLEILELLSSENKIQVKFDYIVNRILEQANMYYDDYVKLEGCISEMRIFPGGKNIRIYCKELKTEKGAFYIIAARLLGKKKDQKITKAIKQIIDPLENFEYELPTIIKGEDKATSRQ